MAKMGRPVREIDWNMLNALLPLNASLDYCCEKLLEREGKEITHKAIVAMRAVIERRIRDKHECTFVEYRTKKMETIKLKLLQKQLDVAFQGNTTMLIWLGKIMLKQRDTSADIKVMSEKVAELSTEEVVALAKRKIHEIEVGK
jgi:hypothetical protein